MTTGHVAVASQVEAGSLRIGLDAHPLATVRAGIGRYVFELCRQLDTRLPEAKFYCYSPKDIAVELPSSRWVMRVDRHPLAARMPSYWWLKTRAYRMCAADGIAVFWGTRTILPSSGTRFRTVATVHDLNHLIVPDSMPPVTRLAHRWFFARDLRRANAVITNSEATARRLAEHLGVRADGVAKPGVSTALNRRQAQAEVDARLRRLGVQPPYFLAVGTLEPRKNLETLIAAFRELSAAGPLAAYHLVIVGQAGWKNSAIHRELAADETKHVRWLGYVADDDLAALYQAAVAFVMPSLYEGFGMPALEARACGTRLLASDIPELREAGGPEGMYVTPDKQGIKQGLVEIITASAPRAPVNASWEEAGAVMAHTLQAVGD